MDGYREELGNLIWIVPLVLLLWVVCAVLWFLWLTKDPSDDE